MSLADAVLGVMFLGVTAYALFGGADFGAGVWDLFAGGTRRGADQRRLIERSLGPVWEANHVWLIFVLVVLWTAVPLGFASIASTLYVPLTLAGFGMIARGSAFAFRHSVPGLPLQRALGAAFAFSSVVTPFFLGTIAGAVASGRVPPGIAAGNVVTSWLNPVSILGGILAVGTCAYLAAVFLCGDAERAGEPVLAAQFRLRAIAAALVTGVIALAGIAVLASGAPRLFDGLTGRGLPAVAVSAAAGIASIALLVRRRFGYARIAAALAVAAILWGWALAQYPYLLTPSLTIAEAAAARATLTALLGSLLVGAAILVPSLWFLYRLFQRSPARDHS
ncbi:MAG: cytochrome bd ubiquinol oxidase subunit [Cryptosporangiaceae bacterium]|nr:cytochrome bd ubiquinol oxidase subunit [Cryptosporangiaceae bacterium]